MSFNFNSISNVEKIVLNHFVLLQCQYGYIPLLEWTIQKGNGEEHKATSKTLPFFMTKRDVPLKLFYSTFEMYDLADKIALFHARNEFCFVSENPFEEYPLHPDQVKDWVITALDQAFSLDELPPTCHLEYHANNIGSSTKRELNTVIDVYSSEDMKRAHDHNLTLEPEDREDAYFYLKIKKESVNPIQHLLKDKYY